MSALSTIHTAQDDVAKLQSTLTTVQAGLDSVETVAETAREARRGMRRFAKVVLLLAVIGVIAMVVKSKASQPDAADETT